MIARSTRAVIGMAAAGYYGSDTWRPHLRMTQQSHEFSESDLADAFEPEPTPSVEERRLLQEVLLRMTGAAESVTLGGYELEQETLGRGAMGTVVAAREIATKRRVALKILHRRRHLTSEAFAREEVLREAKMMAGVIHRNVVTVHRIGFDDGQAWIAMELVEGPTLREWQREERPWSEILGAYVGAGRGLAAAHERGIVHGDFKPDNVLIDRDGTPKLTDFGLAALNYDGLTLGGTPQYMAPEQLDGQRCDERSEQFSFCVALFEALTGTHPYVPQSFDEFATTLREERGELTPDAILERYRAKFRERVKNNALRWPRLPLRIPRRVRMGLVRGLDPRPAMRFPRLDELLDALDLPRAHRRSRFVIAASAAGLVFGAAGAWGYEHQVKVAECRDPGARFAEVWNEEARATLASDHPDAAGEVGVLVGRLKERWSGAYAWSCERTALLGDWGRWEPIRRCLDGQLASLQSLVDALPERSSDDVRAIARDLAGRSPDACALTGESTPGELGEALRADLQRATIHLWAYEFEEGLALVEAVLDRAKEHRLLAMEAEAFALRGEILVERSIREDKAHEGAAAPGMADLRRAEIAALVADVPMVAIDAWLVRARALAVMHDASPRTPLPLDFLERLAAGDGRVSRLLKDQEARLIEIRGLELYNEGLRGVDGAHVLAREALERAIRAYEAHGERHLAARARENLSTVLVEEGRFADAVEVLKAAESLWPELGGARHHEFMHLAKLVNATMMENQAFAQGIADAALSRDDLTRDERVVLMLPSIYAFWGEPRAFDIAVDAMALIDDPEVKITALHEVQLRIAALGALGFDERAGDHLREAQRWADELSVRWMKAPTDGQRALALAYLGRARLLEKNFSAARDRLLECREHMGWKAQQPEVKVEVLFDLAESNIALDGDVRGPLDLDEIAALIAECDDEKLRHRLEDRLQNLRRRLESPQSRPREPLNPKE
ncbi:MAG: serine/threonine protein kinase [Myxococcales bacterium]|nr:serine/threonine protein kinase [Myxococcales bacterium]